MHLRYPLIFITPFLRKQKSEHAPTQNDSGITEFIYACLHFDYGITLLLAYEWIKLLLFEETYKRSSFYEANYTPT